MVLFRGLLSAAEMANLKVRDHMEVPAAPCIVLVPPRPLTLAGLLVTAGGGPSDLREPAHVST